MREAFPLFLVSLLFAFPALAQNDTGSAEHVAAIFCESHGDLEVGLREPYLSPALAEAIAAAKAANARFAAAHPEEKPPLGDGIPWQSWPDFAESCTPGEPLYMMDEARLTITYAFPEYPDAGYSDRLWLVLLDRHWLIDNVCYHTGDLKLRDIL